jgi:hypothetical protein
VAPTPLRGRARHYDEPPSLRPDRRQRRRRQPNGADLMPPAPNEFRPPLALTNPGGDDSGVIGPPSSCCAEFFACSGVVASEKMSSRQNKYCRDRMAPSG